MSVIKLPCFESYPECSVGLMTLDDAWRLITQGQLTIEGAKSIFPERAWVYLPQSQHSEVQSAA
jgi:hypothetical protein